MKVRVSRVSSTGFGGLKSSYFGIKFPGVSDCDRYPETCTSTLVGADTTSPKSYVSKSMGVSMTATNETLGNLTRCRDAWPGERIGMQYSTLQMCVDMYEDIVQASGRFLDTLSSVSASGQPNVAAVNDLEQRASAALTFHFTCVNGLQEQGIDCGIDSERMTELLSNALSLVDQFTAANDTAIAVPSRRRLLDVTRVRLSQPQIIQVLK